MFRSDYAKNHGVRAANEAITFSDALVAAQKGICSTVREWVEANPNSINAIDAQTGCALLHYAACKGHAEVVSYLIAKGARVDQPANFKQETFDMRQRNTALHLAAKYGHFETAKRLVAAKADVNLRSECLFNEAAAKTALHWVIDSEAEESECNKIAKLFIDNDADLSALISTDRTDPLIKTKMSLHDYAVRAGKRTIAEMIAITPKISATCAKVKQLQTPVSEAFVEFNPRRP